ncbi:predicted protein [Naegleria gruberi]|uniref:Predicted protein n=1 Tax=Naegleria gruberi TaxID=5762 RepID=D2VML6_NAEGR|nr:uncharacterized protein NAEGRDRAFT_80557 [Naegleria gruberi]EFC42006.1 predicted protein [Naegleria gruberi]|eukprot:XP_002674750.1 predicted protein [Naegleria gruberi strain NEG-M]
MPHSSVNFDQSPNVGSSKTGRKRSKSSSKKRNEEIQPLLMNVGNEMNNLKDARAQFKLTCSMVLNILIFIFNMLFMCLLTSILVYVVSPVYINHDVHNFGIGTIDSAIPSISSFRAASIDGNGKVYQGFGMGFSYSNTEMQSLNISDGNTVAVSLFPAFQSILLARALVANRGAMRNSSWDVTLNSMVLNQGQSLFQPEFTFTISRNQSKGDNETVWTQLEAFVHSSHYMYFFQKARTATCLVIMERFIRNRQNMMTVSIYGIVGTALSSTSHVYTDGPFLINNYTFIDDGSVNYATIKRSISMTAVQIDGTHQDLFVVSHNFETDTCMYHSIKSATEMSSNNLPSGVSCYSVDTTNTQMIETLQDSVIAATESHLFILGTDGKLIAIEAVPSFSLCESVHLLMSQFQRSICFTPPWKVILYDWIFLFPSSWY